MAIERIQNYVAGEWVGPKNNKFRPVYDPARGQAFAEMPDSDALDVVFAIQAAQKAFGEWSAKVPQERARILHRIADLMEEQKERLAELESRNVGKPLWLAKEVDLPRSILNFRYFASLIVAEEGAPAADFDQRAWQYVRREPLGVVGLISPWNLPLYTLTFKIAPSLAVGNTVVCKPSEFTPMTAFALSQIMAKAGVPSGVCNFVFGTGDSAGAPLVSHPGVPMISFTGSTGTGEKIQQVAGPMMKRLSLELGGKNATIVFRDAELDRAIEGVIRASFLNSGQICICGSRLLVQQEIYDEFMERFRKATQALVVGDPQQENTYMGPLVSAAQWDRVHKAVEQARREDGRVTVGGGRPEGLGAEFKDGYFFAPTIIEDLTNCSDLWQYEIFGPVVTAMSFKYPNDGVKWANTSPYGLSASIWTKDLSRAHQVAAQIKAGTIWVNTWGVRDVRMPFGGYKHSGIGREGGLDSLRAYSETKTVCMATQ